MNEFANPFVLFEVAGVTMFLAFIKTFNMCCIMGIYRC